MNAGSTPAAALSTRDLADLLTRGYEGYAVPVRMDAPQFEAFVRERDVDLARSIVRLDDAGRPIAVALVGVRGRAGNLVSLAVVPDHRGKGLARPLVRDALRSLAGAGVASCTLEVLEENAPARRAYLAEGFHDARLLPCYRVASLVGRNLDVRETPLVDAHRRAPPEAARPAWPNAWRSASRAHARGYVHPSAGVAAARLFPGKGLFVYHVAGRDPGAVIDGVAALFAGESASFTNVPDASVAAALEARGWARFASQWEMARDLTASPA